MKSLRLLALPLAVVMASCAAANPSAADRPLKVLAIGNSFSICVLKHLPKAAEAAGKKLEIVSLYIGGCSLQRHAENIEKAATQPDYAPYRATWSYPGVAPEDVPALKACTKAPDKNEQRSNIPQMLKADRWDIVTIQQASPSSWNPDTYSPYAEKLIDTIRALAPQAEIVVQQTWSYCNADGRIFNAAKGAAPGSWGFGQKEMYDRLAAAYAALAAKHRLRTIPTGRAIQLYREKLPVTFVPPTPEERAALVRPAVPALDDVVGSYWWTNGNKEKNEAPALKSDSIHLNGWGEYLQACTWLAFLFDCDVADLPYTPDFAKKDPRRAETIRRCAQEAVRATP